MTRRRISDQQRQVLSHIATSDLRWACMSHLTKALFGHKRRPDRWAKQQGRWQPLTGSQRASLARSVRRLVELGLLLEDRGTWRLTEAGQAASADALTNSPEPR